MHRHTGCDVNTSRERGWVGRRTIMQTPTRWNRCAFTSLNFWLRSKSWCRVLAFVLHRRQPSKAHLFRFIYLNCNITILIREVFDILFTSVKIFFKICLAYFPSKLYYLPNFRPFFYGYFIRQKIPSKCNFFL